MEDTGCYTDEKLGGFVDQMARLYNMKVAGGTVVVYGADHTTHKLGGCTGSMVAGELQDTFGGYDIDEMSAPPDDDYVAGGYDDCCHFSDLASGCKVHKVAYGGDTTTDESSAYDFPPTLYELEENAEVEPTTYEDFA